MVYVGITTNNETNTSSGINEEMEKKYMENEELTQFAGVDDMEGSSGLIRPHMPEILIGIRLVLIVCAIVFVVKSVKLFKDNKSGKGILFLVLTILFAFLNAAIGIIK